MQSKAGDNEIVSTRDKISQILEPECSDAEKAHIIFQKKILIDSINDRISKFDDSVKHLYNESIALSADLKYAQIKLQVLYKEWLILKEYDDTDKLLIDKVEMWREEKRGIEERIEKYKQKLNEKRSEIEQIITREREIHEEYRSAVGEDKNEEYLSKVFKRKLRKDNADDCSTDEFQERMPTGIDEELWQRILELRDSRVAQEDLLIQIKQEIDVNPLI